MADRDITIKVKVDANSATTTLNGVEQKIGSLGQVAESTSSAFNSSFASLAVGIGLATAAVGAVTIGMKELFSAVSEGDKINDVADAFTDLAEAAGASSDVLLSKLNVATAQSVSNFDLMRSANDALISGLKPDQFIAVATAAKHYGDALGVDAKTAIDNLTNAIQNGSEKQLKQYGIFLDNTQVLKEYAAQVGKTSDQLSADEQILAKRNAALEALAINTKGVENVAKSAGDQLEVFNKLLTDGSADLKSTADSSVILAKALAGVNTALRSIISIDILGGFNKLDAAVLGVGKALSYVLIGAGQTQLGQSLGILIDKQVEEISVNKVLGILYDGIGKTIAGVIPKTKELGDTTLETGKKGKEAADDLDKLSDAVKKASGFDGFPALTKQFDDFIHSDYRNGLEGYRQGIFEIGQAALDSGTPIEEITKRLGDLDNVGTEVSVGLDKAAESTYGLGDAFQAIAPAITQVLDAAFSGKALKSGDYGGMLGGIAGSISDSFAPGTGPIANSLVKGITGLFSGHDSAGTTARKSADKFFADAFDANRLAVIINGQLTDIKDLVFKGDSLFGGNSDFASDSFTHFFDGLEPAARQAFSGVGAGFEELLGVTDDISGQIGSVLANNIGGSLNNLQLLVESSGKSFEDLHKGVVDAFLDGKLSALEAQSALQGIAQIAQKGIPDGIGFTVQAFQNLEDAGKKGGRVSIDALQDIGFEAKELGLKDFPSLIKNLEASGKFSSATIQKVFDALKASGIDTIDKLTGATSEQLIPVLANLDTVEFPFKEAVADVNDLIKKVNELPNTIEKNLVFNVKVNADSAAAAALKATGSGITPTTGVGLTNQ